LKEKTKISKIAFVGGHPPYGPADHATGFATDSVAAVREAME